MELKIRNRSRWMQVLALVMFATLVWAYAQIEWGPPNSITTKHETVRGSILAGDGSVLARTLGEQRVYPQGTLAGQVLGMMGDSGGLEGAERTFNDTLQTGQSVQLTLDPSAQAIAETALARGVQAHQGQYGAVIMLETRTGRILAAATYPPFDPGNWRGKPDTQERVKNRAFLDAYEPGSTMKTLTIAAAINDGITTPGTVYDTPMNRHVGGRWGHTIGDAVEHPASLTTQQVLRYSSNVGMSHIVEGFTYQKLRDYLAAYGFGQPVNLSGAVTAQGILKPIEKWNDLERATNSFGQGVSGTTLQVAAAYNAVANDGLYVTPRLVEGAPAGERHEVVRAASARTVREMLKAIVVEGKFASLDGYDLSGKTGTAQVATENGYSDSIYKSTYAGFFPSDTPRVTVAVMVHGAQGEHHGSQVAAPIFREIASGMLSEWGTAPEVAVSEPAK